MAVQIQLRRDTASNWTSNNPTLAQGEFAIETDTDKYKIGDGSTAWTSLGYSSLPANVLPLTGGTLTGALTINGASPLVFEGATADAYETTIAVTDPTADRTITLPNSTGTVALTTDLSSYATLASPTLTGTPAAPTASANTSTTQVATTAFVMTEVGDYATLASPTLTGTPAAPTAAADTNTTQVATTAYVQTELVAQVDDESNVVAGLVF